MADLAQQISAEHEKLVSTFADNSYVHVSLSDGAASGKYEVEYKVKGADRQEDGSISISESHCVQISLPFGYPRLSPICRPLTPIFHPDFDSAAICINDYWSKSKSLTGLIIHIGRMIAGQVFGSENVFNPEAAKWYQENSDRLPFDKVDFEKNLEGFVVEGSEDLSPHPIDVQEAAELQLGDSELSSLDDIDIPIGENEDSTLGKEEIGAEPEQTAFPEDLPEGASASESLSDAQLQDQEVVEHQQEEGEPQSGIAAEYAAEESKKKKKIINTLGSLVAFLLIVGGAYFLVMDVVHFKKAESAWHAAFSLLAQNNFKEVKARGDLALGNIKKITFIKKSDAEKLKNEIEQLFTSPEFQEGLLGKKLYDGVYVQEETIPFRKSLKETMKKGEDALVAEEWESALLLFQKAQKISQDIKLDDKGVINSIEKYLELSRFNQLTRKGKAHLEEGALEDAVINFREAVELGRASTNIDTEKKALVSKDLDLALLEKYVKEGEEAYASIQLDDALKSFNQALLLAEKGEAYTLQYRKEILKYIQQIRLYALLEKGKTEYEASDWQAALVSFQEALRFISDDTFDQPELAVNESALRRKIVQTSVRIHEDQAAVKKEKKDLVGAVEEYKSIVSLIGTSEFRDEDEFVKILLKSKEDISSLENQVDISKKIEYLTENYMEIFQANHSLARTATLRHPVVVFVQQDGKKQMYNLKCTGYTGTGKISLELNYFYDVEKNNWSSSG